LVKKLITDSDIYSLLAHNAYANRAVINILRKRKEKKWL